MPKVSVIIPIYNVEKYLAKCLDSVVNQTLKDIEIICVNDGSTDNSLKILEEYVKKDNRIKVISQENKGLSVARNNGIKVATGEYIGFVDSDDWIDLDFYEKLYNEALNSNSDIAVAGIKKYTSQGNKNLIEFSKVTIANKAAKKYKLCQVPNYCYVWNKIYKRNILNNSKILFEEGIQFEDIMFTHRALYYSHNIVTIPNIFYWYKMDNSDSITNQATLEMKKYYFDAYNKALKFVVSHKIKVGLTMPYIWDKDIQYTFLGIHIFRIRTVDNFVQFCLFKNIVLFEQRSVLCKDCV